MQSRVDKMTQQVKVIATKSDNLNSISRACNGKKRTNSQKLSSDNGTHAHTDTEQILKEIQTNSLKKNRPVASFEKRDEK